MAKYIINPTPGTETAWGHKGKKYFPGTEADITVGDIEKFAKRGIITLSTPEPEPLKVETTELSDTTTEEKNFGRGRSRNNRAASEPTDPPTEGESQVI